MGRRGIGPRADPEPMKTVLYQEVDRYNILLLTLHQTLNASELGVQGLVIVTPELEEIIEAVLEFKVPRAWSTCYPSLKPLTPLMRDLVCRISALQKWINEALPRCFWLPGFTYPTGFLTAVLQTSARKNGIAIDSELGVSHHKHPSYVYCTICQGWFILSRALPRRGSMGFRQQLLD